MCLQILDNAITGLASLDRAPIPKALATPVRGPQNGRDQVYVHDVAFTSEVAWRLIGGAIDGPRYY